MILPSLQILPKIIWTTTTQWKNINMQKACSFQLGSAFQHDKPKHAILNADDEASSYFEKVTAAEIMTYGLEQESDVMAKEHSNQTKGNTI